MRQKRYIISGGGTGGHIFPAIAIANEIKKNEPESEILFVGALGKMEMEKVPQAGYEIVGLPIAGLQRRLTLKNLSFPFKVLKSLRLAKKIVRDFNPDIAIGVGGYASGPLLRMAGKLGVKTLIQEQNSYPGITNKLLAKKANTICVAYEGLDRWFPKNKIVQTGNPIRHEVVQLEGKRDKALAHFNLSANKQTLLIVGGSLGARTINQAVEKNISSFEDSDLQVIWQTGKYYFSKAEEAASNHQHTHPHQFIREMDLAYAAADIIVSRAGAMSISELCLIGKPAILVPSPNVSEDHQTKNAMALVNKEAAILVKDAEAISNLGETVLNLMKDNQKREGLSKNILALGQDQATTMIYKEITKLTP